MKQIQDAFFKRAKREGYFARSVYKLESINNRFRLFKKGSSVLDLGSCPGSWLQYIRKIIGDKGKAAGIDIEPVKPSIKKIAFVLKKSIADCTENDFDEVTKKFDAVVSDMAPKTSGIKDYDQARSLELCEIALEMAEKKLKKGGHFVCKIFESPNASWFMKNTVKPLFRDVKFFKPEACRNESFETFIVAKGFGLEPPTEEELAAIEENKKAQAEKRRQKKRKRKFKRKGGAY